MTVLRQWATQKHAKIADFPSKQIPIVNSKFSFVISCFSAQPQAFSANFSGVNEKIEQLREDARRLREQGDEAGAQLIVEQIYQEGLFAEQKIGLLPEEFSQFDEADSGEKPNFRAFLGRKSTKNPFLSHFSVKIDGAMVPEVENKYKDHVYIAIFEI